MNRVWIIVAVAMGLSATSVGLAIAKSTETSRATKGKKKGKKSGSDCDNRATVSNTSNLPASAVAQLRYVNDNGSLGAYASGSLISPHTVLTCGHCVWNRKKDKYNQRPMSIMPGAYRASSSELETPHGSYRLTKVNSHKKTNKKYRTAGKATRANYDYGAMYMVCPFDHLQTYVPLAFKAKKKYVRVNGYPIESLPSRLQGGDQITGRGKVTEHLGRTMHYKTRSTGGASGGPVFVYDKGSRTHRQVGINTHHTTACNGGGVELIGRNRNLILKWMKWKPSAKEMKARKCGAVPKATTWKRLKKKYSKKNSGLFSTKQLRLKKKPLIPKPWATNIVYQYIEGTLYHWKEYEGTGNKRYIKMMAPSKKWLSVKEGRILLTASSKWKRPSSALTRGRKVKKRIAIGDLKPIAMPKVGPIKALSKDADDTE